MSRLRKAIGAANRARFDDIFDACISLDDDDDDDDDAMLRVLGACCDDDRNFTARLPHTNRTELSRIIAVRELALR